MFSNEKRGYVMKIIETYDKNSNLRCYGRNIFKTMDGFFKLFPSEYSNCYYHNLETLKIYKVDQLNEISYAGFYNANLNTLTFKKTIALSHELFHMASNDLINRRFGVISDDSIYGNGFTEGMTEYFNTKAHNLQIPSAYQFEVFCVTMLEDVPNIFRTYFIPNYDNFISLFPNRELACHLVKSVDLYTDMYMTYWHYYCLGDTSLYEYLNFKDVINDIIIDLIEIELSFENDSNKLEQYANKFLNYICSNKLPSLFQTIYPDLCENANFLIKNRITDIRKSKVK